MKYSRFVVWMLLAAFSFAPAIASTFEVCSQLVEAALAATDEVCEGVGRNRACYGHELLDVEPQAGFGPFNFSQVGDTVDVAEMGRMRLSPMNLDEGVWGVALLRLQADIPDAQPENVTLLLFGDVEVENRIAVPVLMDVTISALGNANARREPVDTAFVVGTLPRGQTVTAHGRSEDGQWIYVELPFTEGEKAWVARRLVDGESDLSQLRVIEPFLAQYGPMQAFYLRTGRNQSTCAEAPSDGLLIQTPEGVAEVRLWINEVKIRLGSTAFIQARPGNQMSINTLEGKAVVEALGVQQVAVAGTGVTVQLNDNLAPSSPPSKPKPYTIQQVQNLPVEHLERQITVEPPATVEVPEEPTATEEITPVPTLTPTETATPTDAPTEVPPTEAYILPTLEPTIEPLPTKSSPTDEPPSTDDPPPTEESTSAT